jgi:hypothetical protein
MFRTDTSQIKQFESESRDQAQVKHKANRYQPARAPSQSGGMQHGSGIYAVSWADVQKIGVFFWALAALVEAGGVVW